MPIKTTSIRINYDTLARPKWFMPAGRPPGRASRRPGARSVTARYRAKRAGAPLAVVDELDAAVAVLEPEKVRLRVEPVDVG
jgi:hypothetical protein